MLATRTRSKCEDALLQADTTAINREQKLHTGYHRSTSSARQQADEALQNTWSRTLSIVDNAEDRVEQMMDQHRADLRTLSSDIRRCRRDPSAADVVALARSISTSSSRVLE